VKESDRRTGPYPYYGASGIVDYIDDYRFSGQFALVAEDGENLRTRRTPIASLAEGQFWVNNHAHVLQAKRSANTRFLVYALEAANIGAYLTGSTMPKLTQASLGRVLLPAPDKREQDAISHILGTLDDKIELNRRMNRTLEELARALFTSWFVDFDPVRAKAAGRQPVGMDAATAALFPIKLVRVNGEHMPEGWRRGTVGDLASLARRSVNPGIFPTELFDLYSIPSFDNGKNPAAEFGSAIRSNKALVEPDAILVSKLNPHIPRVWLPRIGPDRRSVCSTEFLVVVPTLSSARPFIYSLFASQPFSRAFAGLVTGTTGSHQRVQPESMLALSTIVPPKELIECFSEQTTPLFDRVAVSQRESMHLAAMRDTLLPKLLSGELSVPFLDI